MTEDVSARLDRIESELAVLKDREAIRDIIRIVEEHSETIIIIAIDNLGKEPILVELAKRFDVPVGLYTLNSRL